MNTTNTGRRNATVACGRALIAALAAAGATQAWAEAMPADARVWMAHRSNVCWDHITPGGSSLCAASDQFDPGGIPLQTYSYSTSWATSFAQASPDSVHSYLAGWDAGHLWVSMRDTYTVHGAARGSFAVTAHLAADGVANSIYSDVSHSYWLYRPSATVEIGTFNATTDPLLEQYRVTPFSDASTARWEYGIAIGAFVSVPIEVSTSYTKSVQVGDVFELGYGANLTLIDGVIDTRNTAVISFDLPEGVWLTSQNGAVFGSPVPEPSTPMLLVAGLLAIFLKRRSISRPR